MSGRLKLGFIGGGLNSAVGATHMIASRMDGLFTVEAACFSRDEQINIDTANQWGLSSQQLYASADELMKMQKSHVDALVILTPTPSHPQLVMQALEEGYIVICEKALATTYSDGQRIAHASSQYNLPVFVTYNYTGYPLVRELKTMIDAGKLGSIQQVHIEMPQEAFERLDAQGKPCTPQSWRLTDQGIPTISLDLGVHVVHMIEFLTGNKPLGVMGSEAHFGHFDKIVDNVYASITYTNEMLAQIWYSKTALGQANGLRLRIYGSEGSAEWFQMEPEYLIFNNRTGGKSLLTRASPEIEEANLERYTRFKAGHPAGFIEAFANHYGDIYAAIQQHRKTGQIPQRPWVFSAEEATAGLNTLETIHQSARTKQWISLCQ